jgi:hypothetical protein
MLAQHAVAPAVDGGHRRLVHPFGRQPQRARAGQPLRGRIASAQVVQQVFARRPGRHGPRVREEGLGRLGQPGADAVAQLLGGGVGEGDDQDLGRAPAAA